MLHQPHTYCNIQKRVCARQGARGSLSGDTQLQALSPQAGPGRAGGQRAHSRGMAAPAAGAGI